MAQLDGTLSRPSYRVPVVAGLVVAGAIALGGVAWSLGLGTRTIDPPTGVPAAPVTRTDRAAILGGIQSEYLAGVAAGWYVTSMPVNPGQLQSEYLRELARDW